MASLRLASDAESTVKSAGAYILEITIIGAYILEITVTCSLNICHSF